MKIKFITLTLVLYCFSLPMSVMAEAPCSSDVYCYPSETVNSMMDSLGRHPGKDGAEIIIRVEKKKKGKEPDGATYQERSIVIRTYPAVENDHDS